MMKVTDFIAQLLIEYNVDTVFGYTGGSIADLVDSIAETPKIKFIETYNEQGAAFAANAYGQISNNLGVAIASSGPGVLNLISGIANAYFDSIPCLFITGNVHSLYTKKTSGVRQRAFQEMDVLPIVSSISKYSTYIDNENNIRYELEKAIYIATHDRKGPVVVDIPYDIQRKEISISSLKGYNLSTEESYIYENEINGLYSVINSSLRPLVLIGGGCSGYQKQVYEFLKQYSLPAVCSLRGLDCIDSMYGKFLGMIGEYGNWAANLAAYNCDLLIVLGSRMDDRQVGYNILEFCPHAKIIQVDIDSNELGKKAQDGILINCNVETFLHKCISSNNQFTTNPQVKFWVNTLLDYKKRYSSIPHNEDLIPNILLQKLITSSTPETIFTLDVGQNQMIAAQVLSNRIGGRVLSSCGLGAMGYSLPAAIGAHFANPSKRIISISGDGGIQMNIQELEVIKREHIPATIIIINNHSLGLIKNLQDKLFDSRYHASEWGYEETNFAKIANAYEISYQKISNLDDISKINDKSLLNNASIIEISTFNSSPFPKPDDGTFKIPL